jgi:hypothetical protein
MGVRYPFSEGRESAHQAGGHGATCDTESRLVKGCRSARELPSFLACLCLARPRPPSHVLATLCPFVNATLALRTDHRTTFRPRPLARVPTPPPVSLIFFVSSL